MIELLQEMRSFWSKRTRKEYRSFGLTMGIFLILLGSALWYLNFPGNTFGILAGGLLFAMALLFPYVLRPLYSVWMSLAVVLGFIMTRLLLSIIYYLVFAPVHLVFWLKGKDPLNRALDLNSESYWIQKEAKTYEKQDSEKQY